MKCQVLFSLTHTHAHTRSDAREPSFSLQKVISLCKIFHGVYIHISCSGHMPFIQRPINVDDVALTVMRSCINARVLA